MIDVIVAVAGRSPSNMLQSADIILGSNRSQSAAHRWIATVFADYPGCVVAVSCDVSGQWCVLAVRGMDEVSGVKR